MRTISSFFRRHPRLSLASVLTAPVAWLLIVYIGSLAFMIVSALFQLDEQSQEPTTELTAENLRIAFTRSEFLQVVLKSVGVAVAVTLLCFALALPMAFYIAKVAKPWARRALIVAVLLPLWAGYLVKGYAWKAMLRPASEFGINTDGGFLTSVFGWTPGFGWTAVILSLSYLWLPYMVLPIYAGLDRLPPSLLDASGDLGARPLRTFRSVVMPMLVPSIAAGSLFTFSLSLGDFIIPNIVTEGKVRLVGKFIESTLNAPNQPLAAAITLWPLLIIVVYLVGLKRLGAFESL
ncbi:MAG TPA: ABC transporter permease [Ilumatobacteraceae bacterium]|nr:ABC transporter permease [Ilumatobacteraceae bacterium]